MGNQSEGRLGASTWGCDGWWSGTLEEEEEDCKVIGVDLIHQKHIAECLSDVGVHPSKMDVVSTLDALAYKEMFINLIVLYTVAYRKYRWQ